MIVKKEAQLPSLIMGYHVPNLRDPDSYVLEVIATILSGGKSSRLYQSLVREKRLVLTVEADYSILTRDPGLFYMTADLLPGKEVAEVEKAIDQELDRLQNERIGERELEKTKNQLEAAFVFAQDSIFYQAMVLAQHEIVSSWRVIDDYIPSIRKVTAEDIQRVSKRYLIPDNRTVGSLIPLPLKEGKPSLLEAPAKDHVVR
jgi:zinc protease